LSSITSASLFFLCSIESDLLASTCYYLINSLAFFFSLRAHTSSLCFMLKSFLTFEELKSIFEASRLSSSPSFLFGLRHLCCLIRAFKRRNSFGPFFSITSLECNKFIWRGEARWKGNKKKKPLRSPLKGNELEKRWKDVQSNYSMAKAISCLVLCNSEQASERVVKENDGGRVSAMLCGMDLWSDDFSSFLRFNFSATLQRSLEGKKDFKAI
jgi:hypothetical protein